MAQAKEDDGNSFGKMMDRVFHETANGDFEPSLFKHQNNIVWRVLRKSYQCIKGMIENI